MGITWKTCVVCGKEFRTMSKRMYCSDECRIIAHARRHGQNPEETLKRFKNQSKSRKKNARYYGLYKEAPNHWRCVDCGRPSNTYRCLECKDKWLRKNGYSICPDAYDD